MNVDQKHNFQRQAMFSRSLYVQKQWFVIAVRKASIQYQKRVQMNALINIAGGSIRRIWGRRSANISQGARRVFQGSDATSDSGAGHSPGCLCLNIFPSHKHIDMGFGLFWD
jgi:hypothetical protein